MYNICSIWVSVVKFVSRVIIVYYNQWICVLVHSRAATTVCRRTTRSIESNRTCTTTWKRATTATVPTRQRRPGRTTLTASPAPPPSPCPRPTNAVPCPIRHPNTPPSSGKKIAKNHIYAIINACFCRMQNVYKFYWLKINSILIYFLINDCFEVKV